MKRWARRVVIALIMVQVAVYLADWGLWALRGQPQASVQVEVMLVVPLKGQKQEFDAQGKQAMHCSQSLYGQGGLSSCWWLRRNAQKVVQP